jgi:hypothetical protein
MNRQDAKTPRKCGNAQDVCNYIGRFNPKGELPDSDALLGSNMVEFSFPKCRVNPNWRRDAGVLEYLQRKGYQVPSTQPS